MKTKTKDIKKLASKFVKIVEWSDEDQCFVGLCPELFGGGTHGDDADAVYAELSAMVEEVLEDRLKVVGKKVQVTPQKFSGKFVLRTGPALHKALSIRATRESKSLNQVVLEAIQTGIASA